jgi:hypothetical protein
MTLAAGFSKAAPATPPAQNDSVPAFAMPTDRASALHAGQVLG